MKQENDFAALLLNWYEENKRDLPWRRTTDPYHIWISEIMLQQTRVEAVKEYYKRFFELLPTLEALQNADEQTLLKVWQGLGYYTRIRNIYQTGLLIKEKYNNIFPDTYEALISLKGIGEYTANAILASSFNQNVVGVDGNVTRIYSRIFGYNQEVDSLASKKKIQTELLKYLIPGTGRIYNQALMELGEVQCIPGGIPNCSACPFSKMCYAYRHNCVLEYPIKKEKKDKKILSKTVVLLEYQNQYYLQKIEGQLLKGTYEPYSLDSFLEEQDLKKELDHQNISINSIQRCEDEKHIFTHMVWNMRVYLVRCNSIGNMNSQSFYSKKEIEEILPISNCYNKWIKKLIK